MLCGGKDVGKSSCSRYIINKLLNRHESVFYLECDCGQTEFTPPAVLSLVKVTKPLFGPPFTHQIKPLKSYFYGHISPGDTPAEYIQLIEMLFQTYQSQYIDEGPLVINQQGWVRGLGLSLLIDCILITLPCYIVQINSSVESRNLATDLRETFMENQHGWIKDSQYQSLKESSHRPTHIKIEHAAVIKDSNQGKNKSMVSRNLAVTSYFSKLYTETFDSFCELSKNNSNSNTWIPPMLATMKPYCVKWSDIAIHVMHQNISFDVMLYAFNLSVVCLAQVPEDLIIEHKENGLPCQLREQPRAEYLGLGIIRNIDPKNQLFYILTPEPIETLEKVNALLKGNIQLPTPYLSENSSGNNPYYCHDYVTVSSKASSGMKPRFNLKRKPSRLKNSFVEK